jgi:hypothetical protein
VIAAANVWVIDVGSASLGSASPLRRAGAGDDSSSDPGSSSEEQESDSGNDSKVQEEEEVDDSCGWCAVCMLHVMSLQCHSLATELGQVTEARQRVEAQLVIASDRIGTPSQRHSFPVPCRLRVLCC